MQWDWLILISQPAKPEEDIDNLKREVVITCPDTGKKSFHIDHVKLAIHHISLIYSLYTTMTFSIVEDKNTVNKVNKSQKKKKNGYIKRQE